MKVKNILAALLSLLMIFSYSGHIVAETPDERLLPACTVQIDGEKWGFIDLNGNFVIKPDYIYVSSFNDQGIAIAAKGNRYSICSVYFINKSGEIVSGPYQAYIPSFNNGIAVLNGKEGSSYAVGSTGKLLFKSADALYDYSSEMTAFSKKAADGSLLFGFKDLTGKVVIEAKYKNIYDYSPKPDDQSWPAPFCDEKTNKYGYKLKDGNIAIPPLFNGAQSFIDGLAIVNIYTSEYVLKYALINQKGEYVLKPEYTGITSLGSGLYAVSKGADTDYSDWHLPKAIFNKDGEKLTDYQYYDVSNFDGEYAVASDNTTTFFIDKAGQMVKELPRLNGIGTLALKDDIIEANLDGGLQYLSKDGRVIWQKDESVALGNGIVAKPVKYRPDYLTFISFPCIEGLENKTVQHNIDNELKQYFTDEIAQGTSNNTSDDTSDYQWSYDSTYSVQKNNNLLIVEKSDYLFPIGAAHGQPSKVYYYIDLKTGNFYEMKDLFKAGSKYLDKLTSLVKQKLDLNSRVQKVLYGDTYYYAEPSVYSGQCFLIGTDSIKFIYQPYEIAAYAYGFQELEIPYGQISDIINKEGAFWNSFDKELINNKISVFDSSYGDTIITESLKSDMLKLIGSYESKIIEAINTNSFSKVAPYLLKGSSLYNSQIALVKSLYKKQTRERLDGYEIKAIGYDSTKNEIKVFVSETIGIKYVGRSSYMNKKFDWCYTVKYDSASKGYKLSNIEKW